MDIDNKTTYQNLREEIMYYTKKQDTCITTAFSLTVSIWSLALTVSKPWLALIPLAIVIPMSMIVCNCRHSIAFLASYMAIFLEKGIDNGWETLREKYYIKQPNKFSSSLLLFSSKFGFGILSFVSIIIFSFLCIESETINCCSWWFVMVLIAFTIIAIAQEIICIRFSDVSVMKNKMMQTWEDVYIEYKSDHKE